MKKVLQLTLLALLYVTLPIVTKAQPLDYNQVTLYGEIPEYPGAKFQIVADSETAVQLLCARDEITCGASAEELEAARADAVNEYLTSMDFATALQDAIDEYRTSAVYLEELQAAHDQGYQEGLEAAPPLGTDIEPGDMWEEHGGQFAGIVDDYYLIVETAPAAVYEPWHNNTANIVGSSHAGFDDWSMPTDFEFQAMKQYTWDRIPGGVTSWHWADVNATYTIAAGITIIAEPWNDEGTAVGTTAYFGPRVRRVPVGGE